MIRFTATHHCEDGFDDVLFRDCEQFVHAFEGPMKKRAEVREERRKIAEEQSQRRRQRSEILHRISRTLEDPTSSKTAYVCFTVLSLMVLVSVVSTILTTMPMYSPVVTSEYSRLWSLLDWGLTICFTFEISLRCLLAVMDSSMPTTAGQNAIGWFSHPSNIVDLLSIIPTYIQVFVPASSRVIIGGLRTLRLLRLFKILRFYKPVRQLQKALRGAAPALVAPLSFYVGTLLLSASAVYYADSGTYDPALFEFRIEENAVCPFEPVSFLSLAERAPWYEGPVSGGSNTPASSWVNSSGSGDGSSSTSQENSWTGYVEDPVYPNIVLDNFTCPVVEGTFATIAQSCWWAVATMSTCGFGDFIPVTAIGRVVAVCAVICGIILNAMPIAVVDASYVLVMRNEEDQEEKAQAQQRQLDATEKLAAAASAVAIEQSEQQQQTTNNAPSHQTTTTSGGSFVERALPLHRRGHGPAAGTDPRNSFFSLESVMMDSEVLSLMNNNMTFHSAKRDSSHDERLRQHRDEVASRPRTAGEVFWVALQRLTQLRVLDLANPGDDVQEIITALLEYLVTNCAVGLDSAVEGPNRQQDGNRSHARENNSNNHTKSNHGTVQASGRIVPLATVPFVIGTTLPNNKNDESDTTSGPPPPPVAFAMDDVLTQPETVRRHLRRPVRVACGAVDEQFQKFQQLLRFGPRSVNLSSSRMHHEMTRSSSTIPRQRPPPPEGCILFRELIEALHQGRVRTEQLRWKDQAARPLSYAASSSTKTNANNNNNAATTATMTRTASFLTPMPPSTSPPERFSFVRQHHFSISFSSIFGRQVPMLSVQPEGSGSGSLQVFRWIRSSNDSVVSVFTNAASDHWEPLFGVGRLWGPFPSQYEVTSGVTPPVDVALPHALLAVTSQEARHAAGSMDSSGGAHHRLRSVDGVQCWNAVVDPEWLASVRTRLEHHMKLQQGGARRSALALGRSVTNASFLLSTAADDEGLLLGQSSQLRDRDHHHHLTTEDADGFKQLVEGEWRNDQQKRVLEPLRHRCHFLQKTDTDSSSIFSTSSLASRASGSGKNVPESSSSSAFPGSSSDYNTAGNGTGGGDVGVLQRMHDRLQSKRAADVYDNAISALALSADAIEALTRSGQTQEPLENALRKADLFGSLAATAAQEVVRQYNLEDGDIIVLSKRSAAPGSYWWSMAEALPSLNRGDRLRTFLNQSIVSSSGPVRMGGASTAYRPAYRATRRDAGPIMLQEEEEEEEVGNHDTKNMKGSFGSGMNGFVEKFPECLVYTFTDSTLKE